MDWQSKVIELLRVEIDDLVELAILAGADPATFYHGADLSGIELTAAETAALAGTSGATDPDEPIQDIESNSRPRTEGPRKGVLAFYIGARTAQAGRPGIGLVAQEPTVLLRQRNGRLIVGKAALNEYSSSGGMLLSSPFSEDKVQNEDTAAEILKHLITTTKASRVMGGLDILHAVPATDGWVQRRALEESSKKAGARRVRFVDAPLAAAVGAGLIVDSPKAVMVVVIGDHLVEVQVISLSGKVFTASARAGLDVMDREISNYLERYHDLSAHPSTLSHLRNSAGAPYGEASEDTDISIEAWSMTGGRKVQQQVSTAGIRSSLMSALATTGDLVRTAIEATPPELAGDIGEAGFLLTGSGAALPGLARALTDWTGLLAKVTHAPELNVIEGCAKILEKSNWIDLPFVHESWAAGRTLS